MTKEDDGTLRSFNTGATRDTAEGKLDYEGFLSPTVLKQFAKYMNMNRLQSDGKLRDSDNWQKGIPMDAYMKSGYRHFFEWWELHRQIKHRDRDGMIDGIGAMCGLMFNVMGYLHELLKVYDMIDFDGSEPTFEMKERQSNVKGAPELEYLRTSTHEKENEEPLVHVVKGCNSCAFTVYTDTEFPCRTCIRSNTERAMFPRDMWQEA